MKNGQNVIMRNILLKCSILLLVVIVGLNPLPYSEGVAEIEDVKEATFVSPRILKLTAQREPSDFVVPARMIVSKIEPVFSQSAIRPNSPRLFLLYMSLRFYE